jgi:hypothetical protein
MQKADTEYLAREIASLRIAMGEVATRDFIRSELTRLMEELDEAEQRRPRVERRGRQPAGRGGGTLAAPLAGGEPSDEVDSDRSEPTGPAATRPDEGANPGGARKSPRAPRGGARGGTP